MSAWLPLSSLHGVLYGLHTCEKHQGREYFIVKDILKAVSSRKILLSIAGASLGQKSEILWHHLVFGLFFGLFGVWFLFVCWGVFFRRGLEFQLSTHMECISSVVSFGYFWKKNCVKLNLSSASSLTLRLTMWLCWEVALPRRDLDCVGKVRTTLIFFAFFVPLC